MNKYKIRYYTSGGYKATGSLDTEFIIKRDGDNSELCLFDNDVIVGGLDKIEELFLDQLGYIESIMVFDVEPEIISN